MIKLIDKGPDESLIEFRPRLQRNLPTITRQLLYGHECKWCGNVIQAMFLTPERLNLDPYEETRVISQGDKNEGNLLKVVPNSDDPASAYKVDFYATPGGNAQLIRLKNHLILWKGIATCVEGDFFEVGERCCKYIGIPGRRETDYIAELARVCRYPVSYYTQPNTPVPLSFLKTWKGDNSWSQIDFRVVSVIGKGSEVLLVNKDLVKGNTYYGLSDLFDKWNKSPASGGETGDEVENF